MLFKLYDIYLRHSGSSETFDEFLYWGEMLLNDFDDIDKYMADARMLFSRIPEPTECLSAITLEQFQSLYGLYFAKEALTDKPCPCFALLRHQEASHYHW